MRHTRTIATAILLASIAVPGCAARYFDRPTTPQSQQPAATTASATKPSGTAGSKPIVLADGPATASQSCSPMAATRSASRPSTRPAGPSPST